MRRFFFALLALAALATAASPAEASRRAYRPHVSRPRIRPPSGFYVRGHGPHNAGGHLVRYGARHGRRR